jgi:SAM-dependent methyltransferase
MIARSPWRTLLYDQLAAFSLQGKVIDLGGSRKSAYIKNFKGDFVLTVADLHVDNDADIEINLEEPFAIKDGEYDFALCINLLEHIFNYQNVIHETKRILKTGGQAIFAVPFLIQVHPSPRDHWRFTAETLERLFTEAGFSNVRVESVGTGVFGALAQLRFGLLHFPILRKLDALVSKVLDGVVESVLSKSTYNKEFYPLGYIIIAKK